MKVVLLFLAAVLVGISAFDYDFGSKFKAQVEKFNCTALYHKCKSKGVGEWYCGRMRYYCSIKLAKLKKALEKREKEKKPVQPPHWNKRRRFCPKKFCNCFGGLVRCIKSARNRTMSFETENKYEADTDEEYYEDRETFRNVSGPPNATLIAEIFLERAGNGSKGNGTRSCFIKFKKCLLKKPKYGMEKDWGNIDEEDVHDGEEDEQGGDGDDDEEGSKANLESSWRMKMRPMWKKGSMDKPTAIFGKIRHYARLMALRLKKIMRGELGRGRHHHGRHHHGRHHHGRHHHGHHHRGIPPLFRRCMLRGRFCKSLVKKKAKMACFRSVAKCFFHACKMLRD